MDAKDNDSNYASDLTYLGSTSIMAFSQPKNTKKYVLVTIPVLAESFVDPNRVYCFSLGQCKQLENRRS